MNAIEESLLHYETKKEGAKNVFATFDRMMQDMVIPGRKYLKCLKELKDPGTIKKRHLTSLVSWDDPFKLEPFIAMVSGLCHIGSD